VKRVWLIGLVACGQSATPSVTIEPTPSASAPRALPPAYAESAQTDYAAAEALARAGRTDEARAAFATLARKFPYSRLARDAQRRIAELASTVGDITCRVDADCTVTQKRDCCECCLTASYATSRKWLAWRDDQCMTTPCTCLKKCAPAPDLPVAVCKQGACGLAP
jgi:hypothetical protein